MSVWIHPTCLKQVHVVLSELRSNHHSRSVSKELFISLINDFMEACFLHSVTVSAPCWSSQEVRVVSGIVSGLQRSPDVLPEDSLVLARLQPAQVGAFLHQLPHAVIWRQLMGRDVLQKQQDQHVFLLVKQAEAATTHTLNIMTAPR